MVEIVSNNAGFHFREIDMKGRKVVVRKPRIIITEKNYRTLQLLDLPSNITQYVDEDMEDASLRVKTYIQNEGISREEIDQYIKEYPERIYKNIYEMRIFDVFA